VAKTLKLGLYLYTTELLPTVIRCTGFGTLSGLGRFGSILGSQVLKLNTDETPWISGVVFGIVTFIAAALIFTLPETSNKQLTQTLDEAEVAFGKSIGSSLEQIDNYEITKISRIVIQHNVH